MRLAERSRDARNMHEQTWRGRESSCSEFGSAMLIVIRLTAKREQGCHKRTNDDDERSSCIPPNDIRSQVLLAEGDMVQKGSITISSV